MFNGVGERGCFHHQVSRFDLYRIVDVFETIRRVPTLSIMLAELRAQDPAHCQAKSAVVLPFQCYTGCHLAGAVLGSETAGSLDARGPGIRTRDKG
jgi:hypothetical protein